MLHETEKYLVESVKKGDYQSFEILFRSYYPVLCKYANSLVKAYEVAEDIVTEVFVRLWEKSDEIKIESSLQGYLFRSVRNRCINYLTRSKQRFTELDADTIKNVYEILTEFMQPDSLDDMLVAELDEKIKNAIAGLPAECAKIFLMSRENELSHREIAQKLNISENTVKAQIYRALLKIREALEKYFQ